jgi:hypothetical protein
LTTPSFFHRSRIARVVVTIAIGAAGAGAVGCTTAPWARTQPKGPTLVLHPDQTRVSNAPTFASVPDVN